MFWSKKHGVPDEQLDEIGREFLRTLKTTEADSGESPASTFAYTRLRAAIAAEQSRRNTLPNHWLATLSLAPQALSVMSLVAVVSLALWWNTASGSAEPPTDTTQLTAFQKEVVPVNTVTACSMSTKRDCAFSDHEVLANLMTQEALRKSQ